MKSIEIVINFKSDDFDPEKGFDVALDQALRDIEETLTNKISSEVEINYYISDEFGTKALRIGEYKSFGVYQSCKTNKTTKKETK